MELQRIYEAKKIGIDLKWDYIQRRFRLSMNVYLKKLRISLRHPIPTKRQLSPHKHIAIQYGAGPQFNESPDTSPPLKKEGNWSNFEQASLAQTTFAHAVALTIFLGTSALQKGCFLKHQKTFGSKP